MSLADQLSAQRANDCSNAYAKGIFFGGVWGFTCGVILASVFITALVAFAKW